MKRFVFPAWADRARLLFGGILLAVPLYGILLGTYGLSAQTLERGYAPAQPVPFSHALHSGELGLDCSYCHTSAQSQAEAGLPSASSCMGCHKSIWSQSAKLAPIVESDRTHRPVQWVRVNNLPDYVYFEHSAHVAQGVSCASCHGRVEQMEVVELVQPHTMKFCLDCHRNPEPALRPASERPASERPADEVRALESSPTELRPVHPSTDCSTCHR